jgi:molybdopterin-guanine dinucleotide biosynthesis protein A
MDVTAPVAGGLTGFVLAGGQSRRMGRDKAFLDVDGVPMIRRVLDGLAGTCAEVFIVTKTPDRYRDLGVPVITEDDPRQAALAGLCAGLRATRTAFAFAAACDLPFLMPEVVARMADLAAGWEAAVPRVGGRWHPLHAVYAAAALAVLEAHLARGDLRLSTAIDALRVRTVEAGDLAGIDPALRSLHNVNTRAEYERIRRR